MQPIQLGSIICGSAVVHGVLCLGIADRGNFGQYGVSAVHWELTMHDLAVLHIGAEQTIVTHGGEVVPQAVLTLPIGARQTAATYFRSPQARPLDIERAIAAVEDEVMKLRTLIPDDTQLCTTDTAIAEIAVLAGAQKAPLMQLSLDAMEQVFARWTAVAMGRASLDEIPTSSPFAATILILREFMHHLQFGEITIVDQCTSDGPVVVKVSH